MDTTAALRRPLSLLVTALSDPAEGGDLIGQVQVVSTGEVVAVTCLADLGRLLQRLTTPAAPTDTTDTTDPAAPIEG